MTYLFDTHAWFWALENPARLPVKVRRVLNRARNVPYGLCAISLWEVAKLIQEGRIRLTMPLQEWMERALDPDMIEILPLSREVAVESISLPEGFHADPADELIVATARLHHATLITADERIQAYPHVKTVWD